MAHTVSALERGLRHPVDWCYGLRRQRANLVRARLHRTKSGTEVPDFRMVKPAAWIRSGRGYRPSDPALVSSIIIREMRISHRRRQPDEAMQVDLLGNSG